MNTFKAVAGILVAAVLTACSGSADSEHGANALAHADAVMNYHRISDSLVTGGHLTNDDSAKELAAQGVSTVIDLRDQPPAGEKERHAAVGIRWLNVPVAWENPTLENFETFSELMSEHAGEHILVQCQANYRASAMTYAYRVSNGVAEEEARKDLEAIWNPEGRWESYLDEILVQKE